MLSMFAHARSAVVVAVIGFGAVTAFGSGAAFAEPDSGGCDGRCNPIPNLPSFPSGGSTDSEDGGGGGGGGGGVPEVVVPKVPSTPSNRPIVVRDTPDIPAEVPPADIPQPADLPQPVDLPQEPVEAPPVPVEAPVIVAPPVPVAVPVPPPVELPDPAPPATPQLPAPQVLLTSSAEPGTQALTLILMFMLAGGWIYGHRIASHWTSGASGATAKNWGKRTDAPTSA